MVEHIANSIEDYLIDGLNFKHSPGASYVTDRQCSTFAAIGSQSYVSGAGSRIIKINIAGDGWLDPSTVRVFYTLQNNTDVDGKILRTVGGPHSFFRRGRCIFNGAVTDDIDQYNRVHQMLSILTSRANRSNDLVDGFCREWDDENSYNGIITTATDAATGYTTSFGRGASKVVNFKPIFGLLNQNKYLPLFWGGMSLEFEVVTNATDAIATPIGTTVPAGTTSTDWIISDVRVECDTITLDSALQNSYVEHVLSGKALEINYGSYINMLQSVAGDHILVNVARAVSRLKTIFFSFDVSDKANTNYGYSVMHQSFAKSFNSFYHPMLGTYSFANELEYRVQIGSKMIPVYPIRSLSEAWYQLKKALGIHASPFHSISIDYQKYMDNHHIVALDCERVLDASYTGINTKSGQLLTISAKGANGTINNMPNLMYITLHADCVLEIRDSGATVFD